MTLKPTQVDFDKLWGDLSKTMMDVLKLTPVEPTVWTESFYQVYSLCVAFPESLADRLYDEVKSLLTEHVRSLYEEVNQSSEDSILSVYYDHWTRFSRGANYLDNLFLYLNQQHISKLRYSDADQKYGHITVDLNDQHMVIGELALEIWKDCLIKPVQTRLVSVLLGCIEHDRRGRPLAAEVAVVRGCLHSLVDVCAYKKRDCLQLYEQVFEGSLLQHTSDFYAAESAALISNVSLSDYMIKVLERKEEEALRCTKFLPPSCHAKVSACLTEQLVTRQLPSLHAAAGQLVRQERRADVANMYRLLRPVPGSLKPLVDVLQTHIKERGFESVQSLAGESVARQFLDCLLGVHAKYSQLVSEVLQGDALFQEALHRAFEAVVNARRGPRSAEIIAKYCDTLLKKSNKGLTESEIDDKLSKSIVIFKYVEDKDVFQKFYSRHLAKRLIQGLSVSMELEELMINRLKAACGYEFTSKLHRMITDMAISESHNTKFADYLAQEGKSLDTGFSINILQAGAWPLSPTSNNLAMSLPLELEKPLQYFEAFYRHTFNGRKLTWLHYLSQGELKCSFSARTYVITLVSYHVVILLHFQTTDALPLGQLQAHTGLPQDAFPKILTTLLDQRLLLASDTQLSPDTVISLNTGYANKRMKFKVVGTQIREPMQEKEVAATHASIEEDRKMFLQAAIVRIMKTRRTLKHVDLVQEVIDMAKGRFVPQVPMIKKCIELLLDKNYIERQEQTEYVYVA